MNRGIGSNRIDPLGFSLVEILISIIILGLGLLGLGALFPVVIRQQRISTDQTLGVIVGESARSKLAAGVYGSGGQWSLFGTIAPPATDPPAGWGLGDRYNWVTGATSGTQTYEAGEWYVDPAPAPSMVLATDVDTQRGLRRGAAWIGDPRDNLTWTAIPLAERLYPADSETPQFAWDFVVHRVSDGVVGSSPANDPVRAAIFVRRIDQRIRVPKDATLREALLAQGGVNAAEQRSPFGEDSQGQPTQDGTDGAGNYAYSQIKSAQVEFYYQPGTGGLEGRDRLYVPTATVTNNDFALLRQPNQKLVDNLGNIYTVITDGVDAAYGRYVKIEPPIPASLGERSDQDNGDPNRRAIREVAFTPQIPVFVTTLEVAK